MWTFPLQYPFMYIRFNLLPVTYGSKASLPGKAVVTYTIRVIGPFLPVITTGGCAVTGNGNLTTVTIGFQDIGIVKPSCSTHYCGSRYPVCRIGSRTFLGVLPLFLKKDPNFLVILKSTRYLCTPKTVGFQERPKADFRGPPHIKLGKNGYVSANQNQIAILRS